VSVVSQLRINLDGTDAGVFSSFTSVTANAQIPLDQSGVIVAPSAGVHTVNVRATVGGASTVTLAGAGGGAGTASPILVSVEKI
jgi:hypothetical protein